MTQKTRKIETYFSIANKVETALFATINMNWRKRGVFALVGVLVALVLAVSGGVYLATTSSNSLTGASIGIESISTCNISVRESVSNLGHDFYCTGTDGFLINQDNIVFDCQDHIIQCLGSCGNGTGLAGVKIAQGRINVTIQNCNISLFDYGIRVDTNSYNNQLLDNHLWGNNEGVSINNATSNWVSRNTFTQNTVCGVNISNMNNNLTATNTFNNITNNKFYNNATAGGGCEDAGSYNYWYSSKTCPSTTYPGTSSTYEQLGYNTTNIIGGPCLGGNWWQNYSGMDTIGGDGLGDTSYLGVGIYGSHDGDVYPLVSVCANMPCMVCEDSTLTVPLINSTSGEGIAITCSNARLICEGTVLNGGNGTLPDMRGIEIQNVHNVVIDGCELYNFTYGIFIQNAYNISLVNVNVHDNSDTGIYLGLLTSNVTVENSTIGNIYGTSQDYGIWLQSAKAGGGNNLLLSNTIRNQTQKGVYLSDASEQNVLTSNFIYNNHIGVEIKDSDLNSLYNNRIYNNSEGVRVLSSTLSDLGGSNSAATCAGGCEGEQTSCLSSCSSGLTSCQNTCDSTYTGCSGGCNSNYTNGMSNCSAVYSSSLTSCTSSYNSCHLTCLGYNQSSAQYTQCEFNCSNILYTNCNSSALSNYTSCTASTESSYGSTCTTGCSNTKTSCRNTCDTNYGTPCTEECENDYATCPDNCELDYNYNYVFNNSVWGYFLNNTHSSSSYGITGEVYNNNIGVRMNRSDVNVRGAQFYNNTQVNTYFSDSFNILFDADSWGSEVGVYAVGTTNFTIGSNDDVNIYNNTYGIKFVSVNSSLSAPFVTTVAVHNNTENIMLVNSTNNYFENFLVYGGNIGFNLSNSNNTIIRSSNVSSLNNYNFLLNGSYNNTIYDNIIDNSTSGTNVYDDGTNNWNISKTIGTNIRGGSYLGGNYWSAYSGRDSDNDGLGDTSYSFTTGTDYLPLVGANVTCGNISSSITLNADLSTSGNCFNVLANNLTINCNNYLIRGSGTGIGINAINYRVNIQNCNLNNFTTGISLNNSNLSALSGNAITNTNISIKLIDSNNGTYQSNTISGNNNYSLYLDNVDYSLFSSNILRDALIYGLFVGSSSSNNTFHTNQFLSNVNGMNVTGSDNLFYNNLFDNTQDVLDTGNNKYNTTYNCSAGSNILGGNCRGGNFWSDYNGVDNGNGTYPYNVSGDGIGDTLTPFNNSGSITGVGDYLPLVLNCGNISTNLILAQNLTTNGTCFNVIANNININCQGHALIGANSGTGISLSQRQNVQVTNCTFINFTYGVYSYWSNNLTLTWNSFSGSTYGTYLTQVTNSSFSRNTYSNNTYALRVGDISSNNSLYNNSINGNGYGIYVGTYSIGNILTNNTIENSSSRGIYFNTSSSNAIYNNKFNNTYNAYADAQSNNTWNSSYDCSSSNILGGSCLGGNFWSDYTGTDSGLGAAPHNNATDGVGDTQIPYNNNIAIGGDYLPYTLSNGSIVSTCPVTIDKDVKLSSNLTCSGGGNGIVFTADSKTLDCDGYVITGAGTDSGIYINGRSNVVIKNCNITNFYYGINVVNSNNVQINSSNHIYNNDFYAVYLFGAEQTKIIGNNIINDNNGIYSISSSDTIVRDNIINLQKKFYGIYGYNSPQATIVNNTLWDNYHGIYLVGSEGANITGNNVTSSDVYSLFLNRNTSNSVIQDNIFTSGQEAIRIREGSNYNSFRNNNVTDHISYGIYSTSANYNNFTSCTFVNNTQNVYLSASTHNLFDGNTINGSTNGVIVSSSSYLSLLNSVINSSSTPGVQINSSSNATITNNTLQNGLSLYDDDSSQVGSNQITGDVSLSSSDGVLINGNNISNAFTASTSNLLNFTNNNLTSVAVSSTSGSLIHGNILKTLNLTTFSAGTLSNNDVDNVAGVSFNLYGVTTSNINGNNIQNTTTAMKVYGSSSSNFFYDNWLANNAVGINISSGSANLIYNNYLENTRNAQDSVGNYWNTTYSCTTPNIVGGPCQAGNFYSDYYGLDNGASSREQGDGIGDQPSTYTISSSNVLDRMPLVLYVARQYYHPTSEVGAEMNASGNVSGTLEDGIVVPNQPQLITYTHGAQQYTIAEVIGLFNQSNVNAANLKITYTQTSGTKTALNKSSVSNLGSAYSLYVYHNYGLGNGVYVCPNGYNLTKANSTCANQINLSSVGTHSSGLILSSGAGYYKVSNITNESAVVVLDNTDPCGASILYSYTFASNVSCNTSTSALTVKADNITINFGGYHLRGNGSGIGLNLTDRTNVVIIGADIQNFSTGIYVDPSYNINLTGSSISNNGIGVQFVLTNNSWVTSNRIFNNSVGINLTSSFNNSIYNNNFTNTLNAQDDGSNIWNTSASSATNIIGLAAYGGNYWSDYSGWDANLNKYGDVSYNITNSSSSVTGTDYLPLTELGKISCGNVTGNVTLGRNVSASGNCFVIAADNLNFNCAGYTLIGAGSGMAINATNRVNFTLINCSMKNFTYGIWFNNVSTSNIHSNSIFNNTYGINLTSSYNNTIYNNLFNSTTNAIDNGNNTWNVSYSCSSGYRNVIGGNCTGGNYWADYSGLDNVSGSGAYNVTPWNITADGIGNTEIPYNSSGLITTGGDYLPLTGAVNLSGSSCTAVAATCSATGISCPGNVVVALVTCSAGQTCSAGVCVTPGSSSGGGGGGGGSSYVATNKTLIECTQSWQCGSWGACVAGKQTRTCYDANDCSYKKSLWEVDTIITKTQPVTSRSCTEEVEVITTGTVVVPPVEYVPPSTPSTTFPTQEVTISSLAALVAFGGIYTYWYFAAPANRLRRRLRKTDSITKEASSESLREHYMGAYGLYLKLSEGKKRNFYSQVTLLREQIEEQLKAEKKIEELLLRSAKGSFDEQKRMYMDIYNSYLKLSPTAQQKYYASIVQMRERLERGVGGN